MPAQRTIGVIGGAIAGPTFALQILSHPILRQAYKPILFDRAKDPSTGSGTEHQQIGGAAVALFGNGIYPLYQLGLRDAFDKASFQTPTASFWNESGDANKLDFLGRQRDAARAEDLQCSISIIERRELQSLLIDRVQELGGEIRWDYDLRSLEKRHIYKTTAVFDQESIDLDLVVGADGGYSGVRKHMLMQIKWQTAEQRWLPHDCGMTGIYAISSGFEVVKDTRYPNAFSDTHGIWLTPGILSTSPLPHGKMRWDVILPEVKVPEKASNTDNEATTDTSNWKSRIIPGQYPLNHTISLLRSLQNHWNPVTSTFGNLLASSTQIIHTPLRQRVWEAHEIQRRNVVLIGDAARLMLPSSGQGTSFAIEDATVLANALLNNPPNEAGDFSAALNEYAKLRVPRSKKMASVAYWAGKAGMGETWYWRWLRSLGTLGMSKKWEEPKEWNVATQWPFNARYKVEMRK